MRRKIGLCVLLAAAALLTGCAVRQGGSTANAGASEGLNGDELRIAATSPAVMTICERLDLPLVGVPTSSLTEVPERYRDATELGSPMSPDMEILKSLSPDWVLSPSSLQSDLQPKYEEAGLNYAFLNLKSVPGMYKSIEELGALFGKEAEAQAQIDEYTALYEELEASHEGKEGPTVLLLMGIPGSYIVATENSYAGSLVELAGGRNVYAGTDQEFLSVNTEDMLEKDPDVILRTAHALPEQVMEMFAEEFETNDIWKHFTAVQEGRVYDLTAGYFGMSATFDYVDALEELDEIFYAQEDDA